MSNPYHDIGRAEGDNVGPANADDLGHEGAEAHAGLPDTRGEDLHGLDISFLDVDDGYLA